MVSVGVAYRCVEPIVDVHVLKALDVPVLVEPDVELIGLLVFDVFFLFSA